MTGADTEQATLDVVRDHAETTPDRSDADSGDARPRCHGADCSNQAGVFAVLCDPCRGGYPYEGGDVAEWDRTPDERRCRYCGRRAKGGHPDANSDRKPFRCLRCGRLDRRETIGGATTTDNT